MKITNLKRLVNEETFQPMIEASFILTIQEMLDHDDEKLGSFFRQSIQSSLDELIQKQ